MLLQNFKSKGLAHYSYFLADGEEALVVDPRRDCEVYVELARRECASIKYVFETHRNEDYVIGSLELQNMVDAEIVHSEKTPFKYGEHSVGDGAVFKVGDLKIEVLHTPGHTEDSLCFVVYEKPGSDAPIFMFTGDTLFIGDVGRTDLPGLELWVEQSEKLYYSLHEKVLKLGDHVIIYPGHGAGSVCGSNMSRLETSTIGYEKKNNPMLQLDKQSFVKHMTSLHLPRPPYFRKMEEYNLHGPPLLSEAPKLGSADVHGFERNMKRLNTVVLDTRGPGAFAASHIPGSINIWLDGVSVYSGWVFNYDQNILLVTERREDVEIAKNRLNRVGFDNVTGCLCRGVEVWRSHGNPTASVGAISAETLKQKLAQEEIVLVDVREDSEWNDGHIAEAKHIYVGYLAKVAPSLPKNKPLATICTWGGRGGLGASILKNEGFEVYNVLGGMNAWENLGYHVEEGG